MPEIPERIGGMPTWGVLAALGAASVVGYLIFFRNKGQAQPSTTPGVVAFSGDINPDYSASIGQLNQQLLDLGSRQAEQYNAIVNQNNRLQQSLSDYASQIYNQIVAFGTLNYNTQQDIGNRTGTALNTLSGQATIPTAPAV